MNIFKKLINKFVYRKKTKMEQEIIEQPEIIRNLINKYINNDYSINIELPLNIKKVVFIASGSSYNSSAIGAKFIAKYAKTESLFFYSGEVVISNDFEVNKDTLYVFTSQSGETADTNLALDKIKQFTDKILVITNTKHSRLWNSAKYKIFTMADSEKAIASTKSMTAQLFCILLVGIKLMQMNNIPYKKYIDDFCNLSKNISDILLKRKEIQYYAKSLSECENAVILGSEIFYYTAIEGTLKFTETSYINTSAFPTGEFLHGHIAILNKKCFVILIVNEHNIQQSIDVLLKIGNNFSTNALVLSNFNINNAENNGFIQIDTKNEIGFIFSAIVIFQLLALESAILLGRKIDISNGLEKVVK